MLCQKPDTMVGNGPRPQKHIKNGLTPRPEIFFLCCCMCYLSQMCRYKILAIPLVKVLDQILFGAIPPCSTPIQTIPSQSEKIFSNALSTNRLKINSTQFERSDPNECKPSF